MTQTVVKRAHVSRAGMLIAPLFAIFVSPAIGSDDSMLKLELEKERPWTVLFAPIVHHWKSNPDYQQAFVTSVNKQVDNTRFHGLSLFRNSFGQPSGYVYTGWRQQGALGSPNIVTQVSMGIIYGYVDKFKDKMPVNWSGFAPSIVPSLGYQVTQTASLDLMLVGTGALVMGLSSKF